MKSAGVVGMVGCLGVPANPGSNNQPWRWECFQLSAINSKEIIISK